MLWSYLDDKGIGITPISIADLQPGTYEVEVKIEGYKDWSETINIINDKENFINCLTSNATWGLSVYKVSLRMLLSYWDNKEAGLNSYYNS